MIAIAYVTTREYEVWNVLLIEHLFAPVGGALGPDRWDPVWNYWFIEVLVVTLVLCAALLSIPAVRGLERAHPFGFALAFLGVCLVLRFQVFGGEVSIEGYRPQTTVWLFAIGWAAVRATRVSHRLLLTVAAVCGALLPGFFDDENARKLVILGGLLLLIWVTRVPMPAALRRLTALLASASLWIYLTQPLTFYLLESGAIPARRPICCGRLRLQFRRRSIGLVPRSAPGRCNGDRCCGRCSRLEGIRARCPAPRSTPDGKGHLRRTGKSTFRRRAKPHLALVCSTPNRPSSKKATPTSPSPSRRSSGAPHEPTRLTSQ